MGILLVPIRKFMCAKPPLYIFTILNAYNKLYKYIQFIHALYFMHLQFHMNISCSLLHYYFLLTVQSYGYIYL